MVQKGFAQNGCSYAGGLHARLAYIQWRWQSHARGELVKGPGQRNYQASQGAKCVTTPHALSQLVQGAPNMSTMVIVHPMSSQIGSQSIFHNLQHSSTCLACLGSLPELTAYPTTRVAAGVSPVMLHAWSLISFAMKSMLKANFCVPNLCCLMCRHHISGVQLRPNPG